MHPSLGAECGVFYHFKEVKENLLAADVPPPVLVSLFDLIPFCIKLQELCSCVLSFFLTNIKLEEVSPAIFEKMLEVGRPIRYYLLLFSGSL